MALPAGRPPTRSAWSWDERAVDGGAGAVLTSVWGVMTSSMDSRFFSRISPGTGGPSRPSAGSCPCAVSSALPPADAAQRPLPAAARAPPLSQSDETGAAPASDAGGLPWAGRGCADTSTILPTLRIRCPSLDEGPAERYRRLLSLPVVRSARTRMQRTQEEADGGHIRRDPFLDDEFLRFVARIPPLALMQGGFCRGLLRESMRGILPEALRLRETKAGLEPACARMVEVAGGFRIFDHLANTPMLADLQIVEPTLFRRRFDEIAGQPLQPGWPHLWAVLAAEAFLSQHARGNREGVS